MSPAISLMFFILIVVFAMFPPKQFLKWFEANKENPNELIKYGLISIVTILTLILIGSILWERVS